MLGNNCSLKPASFCVSCRFKKSLLLTHPHVQQAVQNSFYSKSLSIQKVCLQALVPGDKNCRAKRGNSGDSVFNL